MDLRRFLTGLERGPIVELVYLVGRYLMHGANDASFERMFDADPSVRIDPGSYGKALLIVRAIEVAEGMPVSDMSKDARDRYMFELDAAAKSVLPPTTDRDVVEAVERELDSLFQS